MPRTTVHHYQKGKLKATVTVISPDLTPEEREKRWKRFEIAAADYMRDCVERGIVDINDLKLAEE
jgi:predicted DNA-binding protein